MRDTPEPKVYRVSGHGLTQVARLCPTSRAALAKARSRAVFRASAEAKLCKRGI